MVRSVHGMWRQGRATIQIPGSGGCEHAAHGCRAPRAHDRTAAYRDREAKSPAHLWV
jgi:hypothetical protein